MTTQPTSSSDSITLAAAGPSSTKTEIPPLSDAYPAIVPGGYLCLAWVLKNKRVLIVGGGPVAAGRLVNVKDADAHVTVICPSSGLNGEMKYRLARGEIDVYHDRLFGGEHELDDADHKETNPSGEPALTPRSKYDLVLTATDDESLSRAICNMCRRRRIPVNVADVPPECDFYFGSLIRRGPLQVMVSTGGKGPKIAAQVRQRLERALPAELAEAISNVGLLRARLRSVAPASKQGARRMRWMIDVCEKWSWRELARMEEGDREVILRGWEKGTVPSFGQCRRVRSGNGWEWVREMVGSGLLGGLSPAALGNRCPVSGAVSPWLGGLVGFVAGVGVTAGMVALRSSSSSSR